MKKILILFSILIWLSITSCTPVENTSISENDAKFSAFSQAMEIKSERENILESLGAEWECVEYGYVNSTKKDVPLDCSSTFRAYYENNTVRITSKEEVCIKWMLVRKSNE